MTWTVTQTFGERTGVDIDLGRSSDAGFDPSMTCVAVILFAETTIRNAAGHADLRLHSR